MVGSVNNPALHNLDDWRRWRNYIRRQHLCHDLRYSNMGGKGLVVCQHLRYKLCYALGHYETNSTPICIALTTAAVHCVAVVGFRGSTSMV